MAYKNSETRRAHYLKNREYICGQRNATRLANLEEERAKADAWRKANPGKVQETQQKADAKRRENHKAQKRQRYANADKKELQRKQREWEAANPEIVHARHKRRKALKRGAPESNLSAGQWVEIQSAQNHSCAHCKKRCKGKLTQDHITPLSEGGSHTLHNVIGVCSSCNSKKGTKPSPTLVQPLLLTIAPAKKKAS